jgi:hypothetical protein
LVALSTDLIIAEGVEIEPALQILPRVVAVLESLLQIAKCIAIASQLKTNLLVLTIQKHDRSRARLAVIIVIDDNQKRILPFDLERIHLLRNERRVDRSARNGSKDLVAETLSGSFIENFLTLRFRHRYDRFSG